MQSSLKQSSEHYDVVVLGGGAAGLMAAATAGKRGRKVLVIEASNKLGKKILMSGGGRCNFTNLEVKAEHFISQNPHFVKSALNQYSNWDFISLVASHGIDYHEKAHGQLFCDHSAKDILAMLVAECEQGGVVFRLATQVVSVEQADTGFGLLTDSQTYRCDSLIVATGGLSIPTLGGATGLGYDLAEQFGLEVLPKNASLVPFTLSGRWQTFSAALSGVSLPVVAGVPDKNFAESMLFTHRGLSGPAILQLSNYWNLGDTIQLDLLPSHDMSEELLSAKRASPNIKLHNLLLNYLPRSVALNIADEWWPELAKRPLQEIKNSDLLNVAQGLNAWRIKPSGTEGYRTAEVTKGGVSVNKISSQSMQHKDIKGLFFIGEVLDVTGHLGGFNFQWAWSSGYVAGLNA